MVGHRRYTAIKTMAKRSQKRKVIMTDNNVFMASNSAKIKAISYFAPCIFISVIYLFTYNESVE